MTFSRASLLAAGVVAGAHVPLRAAAQPGQIAASTVDSLAVRGCYALSVGGAPAAGRLPGAPGVVRLDTLTGVARQDSAPRLHRVAIREALDTALVLWRFDRWSVDPSGDTLRVSFSSGFAGTSFALALPRARGRGPAVGDTLVGLATEHRDAGPPFWIPRGRAAALRMACPVARTRGAP